MNGSVRIGSVRGVPLLLHWSVPILVAVLACALGAGQLPAVVPGRPTAVYLVGGLVGAVGIVVGLFLHEIAHALTAQRHGLTVDSITLWALGGVSRIGATTTAAQEFWTAFAGPATSIVLGGGLIGIAAAIGGVSPTTALLVWLGLVNGALGVFNLLPGAPLDGGRVLQALLWWRWKDRARAAAAAATAGQGVGALLLLLGFAQTLTGSVAGLWTGIVGLFIVASAAAERRQAVMRGLLGDAVITEAMSSPVDAGPDWFTVDVFLSRVAAHSSHQALALRRFDGAPAGLAFVRNLVGAHAAGAGGRRVSEVAVPMERCAVADPKDRLVEAIDAAVSRTASRGRVLVVKDGALVGIVTMDDVDRLLRQRAIWTGGPHGTPLGRTVDSGGPPAVPGRFGG